jgi:2-polyprenyl-3-methyl-5-hydroxy-6-metoxy-1,4-benzoquinol methylase
MVKKLLKMAAKPVLGLLRGLGMARLVDPTRQVEGGRWDPQTRRHLELADFIASEGVAPGGALLDVGCGPGWLIGRLRERGFKDIRGCDWVRPSPCDFEFAEVDLNRDGLKNYGDQSFDLVTASDVLEHMENPTFILKEIRRVLKPDGHAFITLPNGANIFERVYFLLTGNSTRFRSERESGPFGHISFMTSHVLQSLSDRSRLRLLARRGGYVYIMNHFLWMKGRSPLLSYNVMFHFVREEGTAPAATPPLNGKNHDD